MRRLSTIALLAIITGAILLLAGCGRKTSPIPPEAVIPAPISDLHYSQTSKAITLSWTYPTSAIDGTPIKAVRRFLLSRAEIPLDDYCPDCPINFNSFFEVAAHGLDPGDPVTLDDTNIKAGHYYVYQVSSNSGWRATSPPSNQQVMAVRSPLEAPAGVTVTVHDQALTIAWQQVNRRQDESGITAAEKVRYQLFRSLDNENFQRLTPPIAGLSHRDSNLTNNRTYYYKVHAIQGEENLVRGAASAVAHGQPQDMTPPEPPREPYVVRLSKGAKVFWQGSPSTDLAGYRIYRRLPRGRAQLLGETHAQALSFTDKGKLSYGKTYIYFITAFDRDQRHNESEPSAEVKLVMPPSAPQNP
ncbi:MAG: fibronectin type III domain-containing protein [Thermodesulfobacteriota bacterium]